MLIKKYGNRRLYDTEQSQYITLSELAQAIRAGKDAKVVDAKTGADLTQETLAQLILEDQGAARLLPVPLLMQLIRMGNDALAEFFGSFISLSLEMYFQTRQNLQTMVPFNPFGMMPFSMPSALSRFFSSPSPTSAAPVTTAVSEPVTTPVAKSPSTTEDELAKLRQDLEELQRQVRRQRRKS